MKKIFKYVVPVVIVLLVVGAIVLVIGKENDSTKFKKEYEILNGEKSKSGKVYPEVNISKNVNVKYADYKTLFDVLDNKTGILYFGFPECPWCRNALPVLLKAASDYEDLPIYYMNILDKRDEKEVDSEGIIRDTKKASDDYYKLLEYLDPYLSNYVIKDKNGRSYDTKEKRIYVPLVVFVKNGIIVGSHSDTVDSQKDPYVVLDDKQKEELENIYMSYINELYVCETNTEGC